MAETYEEPEFEVLREYKRFEVRRYPDSIQARLLTPGTGWSGSSGGFRRIAGYIFGGNGTPFSTILMPRNIRTNLKSDTREIRRYLP